jgi:hypothetical protein
MRPQPKSGLWRRHRGTRNSLSSSVNTTTGNQTKPAMKRHQGIIGSSRFNREPTQLAKSTSSTCAHKHTKTSRGAESRPELEVHDSPQERWGPAVGSISPCNSGEEQAYLDPLDDLHRHGPLASSGRPTGSRSHAAQQSSSSVHWSRINACKDAEASCCATWLGSKLDLVGYDGSGSASGRRPRFGQ